MSKLQAQRLQILVVSRVHNDRDEPLNRPAKWNWTDLLDLDTTSGEFVAIESEESLSEEEIADAVSEYVGD